MAKFFGIVGFGVSEETRPGVWTKRKVTKEYYGDVIDINRKLQSSNQVNDDITIGNEISILADPFAYQNFKDILYINWMGTDWKITNVRVQYPRLVLSLGGIYNGE